MKYQRILQVDCCCSLGVSQVLSSHSWGSTSDVGGPQKRWISFNSPGLKGMVNGDGLGLRIGQYIWPLWSNVVNMYDHHGYALDGCNRWDCPARWFLVLQEWWKWTTVANQKSKIKCDWEWEEVCLFLSFVKKRLLQQKHQLVCQIVAGYCFKSIKNYIMIKWQII